MLNRELISLPFRPHLCQARSVRTAVCLIYILILPHKSARSSQHRLRGCRDYYFSVSCTSSLFDLHQAKKAKMVKKKKKLLMKLQIRWSHLMNRPRLALLRCCAAILQRVVTVGNSTGVAAELNFCKLRPSGAQILLSGSHRHALRITWAHELSGRRTVTPPGKQSQLSSLQHRNPTGAKFTCKLADTRIHTDWQTYKVFLSFVSLWCILSLNHSSALQFCPLWTCISLLRASLMLLSAALFLLLSSSSLLTFLPSSYIHFLCPTLFGSEEAHPKLK